MNLPSIGRLIAVRRREKGLTLRELASSAGVGRSTLAALETGKITELGLSKVARICAEVDLILDARPLALDEPLMEHRHLSETAGRELTKAAIEDVITRGDIKAWRGLVKALKADKTGRTGRRVRDIASALSRHDERARAFATLLPRLMPKARLAHDKSPRT